ncbi:MAG: porin [Gammaproteobacteria bacterium]|nr:porin [Gammaproteobacteria bacterium]
MKNMKAPLGVSIVCAGALMGGVNASANQLYGDIRYSIATIDEGGVDQGMSFNSNAPRFGLKGSYDLDGGNSAFYHVQLGFNNESSASSTISRRFGFVGVKGDWGKTMFGTASSPYKMAGFEIDPFYDTSAGQSNGGRNYGLSSYTNGFFDNVVAYITPKFAGGMQANVVMVMDDSADDEHSFNPGISWSNGTFGANVQLLQVNDATPANESSAQRIALTYKSGPIKAGFSMENVDAETGGDDDYMYLTGTYALSDKTKLSASYGTVDANNGGAGGTAGDGMSLGVFHNVGKKTQIYALVSNVSGDAAADDREVISFGFSQKFSIGE